MHNCSCLKHEMPSRFVVSRIVVKSFCPFRNQFVCNLIAIGVVHSHSGIFIGILNLIRYLCGIFNFTVSFCIHIHCLFLIL